MLIDWLQFGPALLLLLTPIALFQGRHVRFRAIPSGFEQYWGRTFALGLHTIDLGRAVLGAWLLAEALTSAPDAQDTARFVVPATQAGVLYLATMLQTFACKELDAANPPFAFLAGVVIGFLPLAVAGFALFVAAVVAFGLRSAAGFFPILAFTTVGAGILFQRVVTTTTLTLLDLAAVAIAALTPWLFTLLFPRHFVVAYAAKQNSDSTPSLPPR